MSNYEEKIDQLQKKITDLSKKTEKGKCFSTMTICVAVVIPLFVWAILYFAQPSFVQTKDGIKYTRSNKKVLLWTTVLTLLIWTCIYAYTYYKNNSSMFCFKK